MARAKKDVSARALEQAEALEQVEKAFRDLFGGVSGDPEAGVGSDDVPHFTAIAGGSWRLAATVTWLLYEGCENALPSSWVGR